MAATAGTKTNKGEDQLPGMSLVTALLVAFVAVLTYIVLFQH